MRRDQATWDRVMREISACDDIKEGGWANVKSGLEFRLLQRSSLCGALRERASNVRFPVEGEPEIFRANVTAN
jgi:hypothetical protein